MCIICTGEYKNIPDIKNINCNGCTELKEIPIVLGLEELDCSDCTGLITLPILPSLKKLYCYLCAGLTTLPVMPSLKELDCPRCTGLTTLPVMPSLKELHCYKCPWLDHPENPDFKKNLRTLTKAQNIIRRFLKRKYIKNYLQSEAFVAWYYNPSVAGGKKAKQELENIITDLS